MRHVLLLLAVGLLADGSLGADENPPAATEAFKIKAKKLVELLGKEQFVVAVTQFDAPLKKTLPADKLGEHWTALTGKVGAFKKQNDATYEKTQEFDVITIPCDFDKASLDVRVVFNADKQVTGLYFANVYEFPEYVKKEAFGEKEVTVGAGEWALPGTLSVPQGAGPWPAVVLVHGLGAHDRDQTLGPNRPFRDLAWGLASCGIAVLRYEKRTRQHAQKIADQRDKFTIKDELIDDALAAAALLGKAQAIDGKKVFVLGHDLGATFAPKLGSLDPKLAGLVLLAGNARPLEDVLLDQTNRQLKDEDLSDAQKKALERVKEQAQLVKDGKLDAETPADKLPFGMPAAYWLSVRGYRPVEVARTIEQPLLILQGQSDQQGTTKDFEDWKKALTGRKNVVLKSYPKLNHFLIDGEGRVKRAEHEQPGHVAKEIIDDIADWIKKQ